MTTCCDWNRFHASEGQSRLNPVFEKWNRRSSTTWNGKYLYKWFNSYKTDYIK